MKFTARQQAHPTFPPLARLAAFAVILTTLACARSQSAADEPFWSISRQGLPTDAVEKATPTVAPWISGPRRTPGAPILTPTPDSPHALPALRSEPEQYTVQPGDTLGTIATRYGVPVSMIIEENSLDNPNILPVGLTLTIPAPPPQAPGPNFKVIPDSELVNSPYTVLFNVEEFVKAQNGYLATYTEEVGEEIMTGAQIVAMTAQDYSVNPRLLLAVLERQSGWVTQRTPRQADPDYPYGWRDPNRKGLYRQISWAANNLNRGYYAWKDGSVAAWILADGTILPIAPTINAGTAGVQHFYALLDDRASWEKAVSAEGLQATYAALFGYPFDYAIEPLIPPDLLQPSLALPFEPGMMWYYTGGPHGGWGDGSAWAALDFAPPGKALGCVLNDAWTTAVADGIIVRAHNGAVIEDLDGDGIEQTGWSILYLHVDQYQRVQAGTVVKTGDHIGHQSCEGGVSNGTHLHIARRYNGEWIPAGHTLPFVLGGWVASGADREYDGYLSYGSEQIEAYAGINNNGIQR